MAIMRSGSDLELKNDQGVRQRNADQSDITVSGGPPWNAIGIVLPDHSIQWFERYKVAKAVTLKIRSQASCSLGVSGVRLNSAFTPALLFR